MIKAMIYDFDGVMTDNCVYVDSTGMETVKCNRDDGYAIRQIREKTDIHQVILSEENNRCILARAKKLKIPAKTGITDKKTWVERYCKMNGHDLSDVCYVGNGLNDLEAMKLCRHRFCPCDAHKSIRGIACYFSQRGGYGVILQLFEHLCEENLINLSK